MAIKKVIVILLQGAQRTRERATWEEASKEERKKWGKERKRGAREWEKDTERITRFLKDNKKSIIWAQAIF